MGRMELGDPRFIPFHKNVLADLGFSLNGDSRILDFGCGAGQMVYSYRRAGLQALGVDIYNYFEETQARCLSDHLCAPEEEIFQLINIAPYRIPFPDDTFDFVWSGEVFEHVQNYGEAIAEIHRVLKPRGICLHEFPSKYCPIEGHIYVPLAGIFQGRAYLTFWAWLGIRNSFQKRMGFREVADRNMEYLRSSTNYLTRSEIASHFKAHFEEVRFVENLFVRHSFRRIRAVYPLTRIWPFFSWVVSTFHTRFVFCQKG